MTRTLTMIVALMAVAPSAVTRACGVCDEDKVAATYDHGVVGRAIARHDQLLFVAIDGPVSPAQVTRRVVAAAPRVRGIVTGTLRTSLSPAAFSFALDGRQSPETAVSNFQKAIGDRGARLTLVRILPDGAWIQPN